MNELASRYSIGFIEALIELDKSNVLKYRDEFETLIEVLKKEPDFAEFLGVLDIDFKVKEKFVKNNLKDFSPLTLNFIMLIVSKNRAYFLRSILEATLEKINEFLKIEDGVIYSSKPLSTKVIKEIIDALEKNKMHKIQLVNKVYENLIGGFKIVLTNDIYDASIKEQLDKLKKTLLMEDN